MRIAELALQHAEVEPRLGVPGIDLRHASADVDSRLAAGLQRLGGVGAVAALERLDERLPGLGGAALLLMGQADVEPCAGVVGGQSNGVAVGGESVLLLQIDRGVRRGVGVAV